jgi:DNA polymerase I
MGHSPPQPTLPPSTLDGTGDHVPLLLVDGHNLLWSATFGFPAPIYSRDKTRLLTGLLAFFALLRVAVRDDMPGAAPEIIVVFDGEHGAAGRQQTHDGYKASRPTDDQARLPLTFLPDVKRGLDHCGIAWIELEHAEADDVIATVVHATPSTPPSDHHVPGQGLLPAHHRPRHGPQHPIPRRAQARDPAGGLPPPPGHSRAVG